MSAEASAQEDHTAVKPAHVFHADFLLTSEANPEQHYVGFDGKLMSHIVV